MYINKIEKESLHRAWDYINNILEGCTADEDSDEYKSIVETIRGIESLIRKSR